MFPNQIIGSRSPIKSSGFSKTINWGNLLDGTQKTLGIINQAIPIVYQIKPIISNAKTMFKIADELNKPTKKNNSTTVEDQPIEEAVNKPIFYI